MIQSAFIGLNTIETIVYFCLTSKMDQHTIELIKYAMKENNIAAAMFLLDHTSEEDDCDNENSYKIMYDYAMSCDDDNKKFEMFNLLVDCIGRSNYGVGYDYDMAARLHKAAEYGYVYFVRLLIKHGADVNVRDRCEWTPLHEAISNGQTECVKLLLEHGADVNAKEDNGCTPLHYAAADGYIDIVCLLLEHGADANVKNNDGRTPYDLANDYKQFDIAQLLRETNNCHGC